MASNSRREEKDAEESGNRDQNVNDEKLVENEVAEKQPFAEPWEDSDLILAVEDKKFHVHRLILSMNSPVFKAMFKSGFQEATSKEIPLPEKKTNEVLDFLKQFYIQEREEITMENVEHLLKLSDEYQVKPIFDSCVKFLEKQQIEEGNGIKILILATLYKLENVRQGCLDLLKNMKLQSILKGAQQQDLDKENLQTILSERTERLEKFLDDLYPQFIGMVECCFWLWHEGKRNMKWCQKHFSDGKSNMNVDERLRECKSCKEMITTMIRGTKTTHHAFRGFEKITLCCHTYGGSLHFDESLPVVIEEFSKLVDK